MLCTRTANAKSFGFRPWLLQIIISYRFILLRNYRPVWFLLIHKFIPSMNNNSSFNYETIIVVLQNWAVVSAIKSRLENIATWIFIRINLDYFENSLFILYAALLHRYKKLYIDDQYHSTGRCWWQNKQKEFYPINLSHNPSDYKNIWQIK